VFWTELWREVRLARVYYVDFLADQVLYTGGFFLLSGIFQLVAEGGYTAQVQLGLLVGYLTWRVADGTLLRLSRLAADDAQWGTMEQLWLTSPSPQTFLLGRALAVATYHTARALLIALVAIFFLRLSPVLTFSLVLVFSLSQIAIIGLGFMLVGLQLVYKNVTAITLALSTALLFLTGALAPLDAGSLHYAFARLLPLTAGIRLLRLSVIEGVPLLSMVAHSDFLWLSAAALGYALGGVLIFSWAERVARRRGSLAHY
jgi:ABC-2 type transport system permease protein